MPNILRPIAFVLAGLAVATASLAAAQSAVAANSNSSVSFAVTYSASGSNLVSSNRFWLEGGGAELATSTFHGLGVAASVVGLHTPNSGTGIPVNLVVTTFGPRYSWIAHRKSASRSIVLFAQGLAGEADGFRGLYPALLVPNTSSNSLAIQVGGGIDLGLTHHLSLRLLQADWLRTQLPNSTTNVQNNLRLAAGIVFHTNSRK